MIGRAYEQTLVGKRWQQTISGEGSLLLIRGEPGIGKTCLARELINIVREMGSVVLSGTCYADVVAPFTPFAQAIEQVFERSLVNVEDVSHPVLADLQTLAPSLLDRFPSILPNPPLEPSAQQQRIFSNVTRFLADLSGHTALLLSIEDIHWADNGTLFLLRHIARNIHDKRLLIVMTLRDAETDRNSTFNQILLDLLSERLVTTISLQRLVPAEAQELIAKLLGREPERKLLEVILGQTEGNPFFIEEFCRALTEENHLSTDPGHWLYGESVQFIVPPNVKAVIERRLNKLSTACQKMLTFGAVIGHEFDFDLLQRISQLDETSLLDVIDEALHAQVIREAQREGRARYVFQHGLIAQTLSDELNLRRRARLHEQVGLALEEIYKRQLESHLNELAFHFYQCASAVQIERVVSYGALAGEQMERLFAYDEATQHYQNIVRLLDNAGRSNETCEWWERIGEINWRVSNTQEAQSAYERAREIWAGLPDADPMIGVRLYTKLAEMVRSSIRNPHLEEYIQRGLQLLKTAPAGIERAQLLTALAFSKCWGGISLAQADFEGAEQAATEALHIAVDFKDANVMSGALDALANIAFNGPKHDAVKAWELTKQRLQLFDQLSAVEKVDGLAIAAEFLKAQSEFPRAAEYFERFRNVSDHFQLTGWFMQAHWNLILLYLDWGHWPEALQTIEALLDLRNRMPHRNWGNVYPTEALILLTQTIRHLQNVPEPDTVRLAQTAVSSIPARPLENSHRTAEANARLAELFIVLERFDQAQAVLSRINTSSSTASALLTNCAILIAELATAQGGPNALQSILQAETQIPAPDRLNRARARRAHGIVLTREENFVKANQTLGEALALFEAIDHKGQQARTLVAFGELALAQGDKEQARSHFWGALVLFESVGSEFERQRTEKLIASITESPRLHPGQLTVREVEVLHLVSQGLTNAQIAETLVISPFTVNAHLRSIYGKVGVRSRAAATRFAIEHGL